MTHQTEWKTVYQTISNTFASVVQETLQKGGYECVVERNHNKEIHLLVKKSDFENALRLLITDQKHGEIFDGSIGKKEK